MLAALDGVGAALVGGHTEVTAAVRQPVVSGTMLGLAEDGRFVPTGGVGPGDVIVQVGRAPVEGAAVLTAEAAGRLGGLGAAALAAARDALERPGISVVAPALAAARLGATAMHDPTEGGLATGLWELADASGLAIELDEADVLWFEPGLAVCRALGADPWGTLASGALLAAFAGDVAAAGVAGLARLGFEVAVIGRAAGGAGVRLRDGSLLPRFDRDEVARVLSQG
jgi:hydrogenase maturation factor